MGGFEFRKRGFGGIELAEVTAQDGVDEAGLRAEAGLFGLLDGFIDGGVVGDAVEPENLVEAKAQECLQHRLLGAALRFARDQPIQRSLPTDDAIHEFLAEAAIGPGEMGARECGFEEVFHEIRAAASALQNLGSNLSWFLLGQFV